MIKPPVPAKASGRAKSPTGTAGETIKRTNQDARLRTMAATSRIKSGFESVEQPAGWFATELPTNQAMHGTDSRASTHPAELACHERSIRPRTNHANEVVIPHVGHSLPVIRRNEQGRIPSWVCVPKPRGSGSSFLARPKSPSIPAAATKSTHRIGHPNGSAARRCRIMGGPPLEKTCTRRTRLKARAWKGTRTLP